MQIGALDYQTTEEGFLVKRRGKGLIKTFEDKDGYLKYHLQQHGRTFNIFVHQVIWLVFRGAVPGGLTIDHIDGDKTNNQIENLQLLTPEENAAKGNARKWIVVSPDGVETEVYNLQQFCREMGFHKSHLYSIARGTSRCKSYKGWTCYEQR